MTKRNVKEQAEKGRKLISYGRDLSTGEIIQLIDPVHNSLNPDALLDAISTAFYFGCAVGIRQGKEDARKRG